MTGTLSPPSGLGGMHYDFTKDLAEGHKYEAYLIDHFRSRGLPAAPNPFTDYEHLKAFDFYIGDTFFEAKFDAMSERTGNLCLELDLLLTAAQFIVYGLPYRQEVYNHVFEKFELWKIVVKYYDFRKWVGSPRVEVVCPPLREVMPEYGKPLVEWERELTKQRQ